MSQSPLPPLPPPGGPQTAARPQRWPLASALASLIFGIFSQVLVGVSFALIGAFFAFRRVDATFRFASSGAYFLPFAASFVCGVIGVALGHLARRRAAPDSSDAALAAAGLVFSYMGALVSLALILFLTPVTRTVTPAS